MTGNMPVGCAFAVTLKESDRFAGISAEEEFYRYIFSGREKMKHLKLLFVLCTVLSVLSVFSVVSAQDLNPVSSEVESRFQTE